MDILRHGRGSLSQVRKEERVVYNPQLSVLQTLPETAITMTHKKCFDEPRANSQQTSRQSSTSLSGLPTKGEYSNSDGLEVQRNSQSALVREDPCTEPPPSSLPNLPFEIQQQIYTYLFNLTEVTAKVKKTPEHSLGQVNISNVETNFAILLACKRIYAAALPLLQREPSLINLTLDLRSLERYGRPARPEFLHTVARLQRNCTKLVVLRDQFTEPVSLRDFPRLRTVQVRKVIATDDSSYWPVKWLSNRMQGRHDSEELAALKGVAVNVCIKLAELFCEWGTGFLGDVKVRSPGLFKEVVVIREWRVYLMSGDLSCLVGGVTGGAREGKLRFVLVYDDACPMGRLVSREFVPSGAGSSSRS